MLTYLQVHLLFLFPPILVLFLVLRPVLGRRECLKAGWLALCATVWTTPWDNWIISQGTWTYPPIGSVLFRILYVPIEEHMFFVLQPVLLVLLHTACTAGTMVPIPRAATIKARELAGQRDDEKAVERWAAKLGDESKSVKAPSVQTLARNTVGALRWFTLSAFGCWLLFGNTADSNPLRPLVMRLADAIPIAHNLLLSPESADAAFYFGAILAWLPPVLGILTYLGGSGDSLRGDRVTMVLGVGWLWMVDTVAIRSGTWRIETAKSTGWMLWRGLPAEEAIFFVLTSYLIVLSCALVSHLHLLLFLCPPPGTPRHPPRGFFAHISLLAQLALNPPEVDAGVLLALQDGEETLRKGSKSFAVAKYGWGREMRSALVAVYGWCRVTDNLIDEAKSDAERAEMLHAMESFLDHAYSPSKAPFTYSTLPPSARPAFYLFLELGLPSMIPRAPFDDLVAGYRMDLAFPDPPPHVADPTQIESLGPIKSTADLIEYSDKVAGSVAEMICRLCWAALGDGGLSAGELTEVVIKARTMGQALQLVNISRDIRTDAALNRVYIPLNAFRKANEASKDDPFATMDAPASDLESLLRSSGRSPSSTELSRYTQLLLRLADDLRSSSQGAIAKLPRTARAGTRAMVASYFEIAVAVRRDAKVNHDTSSEPVSRVKVSKRKRLWAVCRAVWFT